MQRQHHASTIESIERKVVTQRQQRSKTERVQWVGPPYPSRGRRSRINLLGLVQQAHTGIDTTGVRTYLAGVHLEIGYSQYKCTYNSIMIMSRKNRKLDRLKMYSKGATNETRTCAVPNARPTDEFLLVRGGGGEQRV